MNSKQIAQLGQLLRQRREALGLSVRQVAAEAGVSFATVSRIEQGQFGAPGADKIARLGAALKLNNADLFSLTDYRVPSDLPSFRPYLRSKYRGIPEAAVEDLERAFARTLKKHGYKPNGPKPGEDELP